jgi:hypothetical protein
MLPGSSNIHVVHTPEMKSAGLHAIMFTNRDNQREYHIHSNSLMPGDVQSEPSHTALSHAVSIMYHDAKNHMGSSPNAKILLQGLPDTRQTSILMRVAKNIATRHDRKFTDHGLQPLTSNPRMQARTFLVESTNTDVLT